MSEQKQELTYILGAGASYQSIPVVKTFAERFNDFASFLNSFSDGINPLFVKDEIRREEIKNIEKIITQVYEEFKNHQSFDTYFKKLFHTKNTDEIDFTKRVLNFYFLWEHSKDSKFVKQRGDWTTVLSNNIDTRYFNKQSQIDKRYDALIAGLLQPNNNLEMFCKTNFISWNYDINLLSSLKNYFSPDTTFDEFLNEIKTDDEFVWKIKSVDITIINMNGYFYSDLYANKKNLNDLELKGLFPEINSYLQGNINKSDHKKIKFSWESDNEPSKVAKVSREKISNSKNVVVIGYTFPLYNRLVDYEYFDKNILSNKQLHIQDPDADNLAENLKDNFNIILNPANVKRIKNCDSFYVPSDIIDKKNFRELANMLLVNPTLRGFRRCWCSSPTSHQQNRCWSKDTTTASTKSLVKLAK